MVIVLVTCEEKDLHKPRGNSSVIMDFLSQNGYEPYLVTRAGGVYDLVRATSHECRDLLFRDISVGVSHGASKIVALNHDNCKRYRHGGRIISSKEEREMHGIDLLRSCILLRSNFSVPVDTMLACLEEGSLDSFSRIIPIKTLA